MRVTIIAVGKIKEKYFKDAISEYVKRLSRYCKIDIIEVMDKEIPDKLNENIEDNIKKKEAVEILSRIKAGSVTIALDIKGDMWDSCELSEKIGDYCVRGNSHITFIIGGSLGLHSDVLDVVNKRLSFSKMTFPHKLMRVILLEQVYRAFKILNGETYHK